VQWSETKKTVTAIWTLDVCSDSIASFVRSLEASLGNGSPVYKVSAAYSCVSQEEISITTSSVVATELMER
jgi:hypothetical protein